ncbi:MAG: AAA family ATPase [Intestinibacter bartlettii]
MESIITLNKINIKNLKNVYNGSITFNKESKRETLKHVTGIYGQNGSGKTSIIDSLVLLKELLLGRKLSNDFIYLISANKEDMILDFEFLMGLNDENYKIFYEVEISKVEENLNDTDDDNDKENPLIKITKEKISYSKLDNEKWTRKCDILNYEYENKKIPFTPKKTYEEMVSKRKD